MFDWTNLHESLRRQRQFSDLFFDADKMTLSQRRETLKTFVLSMHADATGICEAVDYRDHRMLSRPIDVQKVLYKSVDAYRYILAILNLFGIGPDTFSMALAQKDEYLHYRHNLSQKKWSGQPVVLFDMDDVLAEFRKSFCAWATEKCGSFIDPESDEYYNVREFKRLNVNGETYFRDFISGHGFLSLERNENYYSLLKHLQGQGYWIQILTARPATNLTCFYDTYSWLSRNGIEADGVAFAPEKFMWLTEQKFYMSGRHFAVDDSAKHSAEYAKHGVKVIVPEKPYNQEVKSLNGITYVPRDSNPVDFIPSV